MSPRLKSEQESEKLYYPIGEVAEMFAVNTSLIRFWEKEFDILKPKKNKKGNRLFTDEDVEHLRTIYHIVKERGYTLEGARKFLDGKQPKAEKDAEIRDTLVGLRNFLAELKDQL